MPVVSPERSPPVARMLQKLRSHFLQGLPGRLRSARAAFSSSSLVSVVLRTLCWARSCHRSEDEVRGWQVPWSLEAGTMDDQFLATGSLPDPEAGAVRGAAVGREGPERTGGASAQPPPHTHPVTTNTSTSPSVHTRVWSRPNAVHGNAHPSRPLTTTPTA